MGGPQQHDGFSSKASRPRMLDRHRDDARPGDSLSTNRPAMILYPMILSLPAAADTFRSSNSQGNEDKIIGDRIIRGPQQQEGFSSKASRTTMLDSESDDARPGDGLSKNRPPMILFPMILSLPRRSRRTQMLAQLGNRGQNHRGQNHQTTATTGRFFQLDIETKNARTPQGRCEPWKRSEHKAFFMILFPMILSLPSRRRRI